MTKRRPSPDTRPHWSDPDLPAIRNYKMGDGTTKTEVDPDYEAKYRKHLLQTSPEPDYKHDPTYELRKRR